MPCISESIRLVRRLALCVATVLALPALAQAPALEGQTLHGFHPFDPSGALTSTVGSGSFDVNAFLGAGRYYNHSTPITGQNTITTNLEAGHMWNGHESLAHVTQFTHHADAWGTTTADLFDRHATWVGMLIGGRMTTPGGDIRQQGIAYGTDLRSAAIATGWSGSAYALSFSISANTYVTAYADSFGVSDVVNSSYGYTDASGTGAFTLFSDAQAVINSRTTHVVSAGNSGPFANTVGAPGSGYNGITVAALGGANEYDAVASFSSRGPQDFGYYDADLGLLTVAGVRAAVDLAAPGTQLVSAFYGGQTGGNNTTLAGSANAGSVPNAYSSGINGTSFAAPIVAGGAALVASAAKTLPGLSANPYASESMVVKALLLTGADKTAGWSNGQNLVNEGGDDFLRTTQSLDWDVGAGRMNLDRTFDIQVSGQQDVAGFALGAMGAVASLGWDYGAARFGTDNDYILDGFFPANSSLGTTLAWLRVRDWDAGTGDLFEVAQADLNLSVWALDGSNAFDTLVAESVSAYNVVEHLSFVLPSAGRYGLRVSYGANTFDNTVGDIWGTEGFEQAYGLAWMVVVPEPAAWLLLGVAGLACLVTRRRRA